MIPVGAGDQHGPLATPAIISYPLGTAPVFGKAQPDLFAQTGRHGEDRGVYLYPWVATSEEGVPVFGHSDGLSPSISKLR